MTERRVVSPLRDFFHQEAAGGIVLVAATVIALIWANSPWKESYFHLWHTQMSITIGTHSIDLDLQEWVNDALMAIFFLVVGLEIKREVVEGELRDPRTAALPAIAAIGGMPRTDLFSRNYVADLSTGRITIANCCASCIG